MRPDTIALLVVTGAYALLLVGSIALKFYDWGYRAGRRYTLQQVKARRLNAYLPARHPHYIRQSQTDTAED